MKDRRRTQRIVLVLGSLLLPGVALANQPPAFQLAMSTLIALPMMMVLTLLGGGYAVMRERENGPRRWTLLPGFLAALVAIVFAATHESAAVMVLFVFTLIAVARGCMMLWWGLRLRVPFRKRPSLVRTGWVCPDSVDIYTMPRAVLLPTLAT